VNRTTLLRATPTAPSVSSHGWSRPADLYPAQESAIFNEYRVVCIEASTKSGKTVGCLAWIAEQAMINGQPGFTYWWIAPIYSQARIAFERYKRYIDRQFWTANDSDMRITLANGSSIWFKSAEKPDALYGEDVRAAVIDEASRVREASWHAIRTTLTATQGAIRIIGNVKGRRNWFYRLSRRAEAEEPGYAYARLTAYDAVEAGILSPSDVQQARADLPAHIFQELYEAQPSVDTGNPFGEEYITACTMSGAPVYGAWNGDAEPVAWGWDLAKSHDWTVGIALDQDGAVCRLRRFQRPWMETIDMIRQETANIPALVDSTGVGDPVLEALQRPWSTDDITYLGRNFEGLKFTSASKQQLMEGLAVAIQQQQIAFPAGVIPNELNLFEFLFTRNGTRYSAVEGAHDDAVDALALAVSRWRHPPQRWGAI
jgi:hypothetical protein